MPTTSNIKTYFSYPVSLQQDIPLLIHGMYYNGATNENRASQQPPMLSGGSTSGAFINSQGGWYYIFIIGY
jgi:hypothetical protein